ncbi:DUF952 domain-containing protein [Nocardioides iriomotensis]|uniref:DUF952 domain-containing protein n=1 Tax=Nocardioides iriomotensis TaxID=715784 RepID=A0A4Q5IYD3_9ACTN|nr:DUF952 domain-containing protein [Nocardioides iriomotensis]RYU10051.1 DUF952 domain-containing protein [Nocardioides iriomotensis]
MIFHVTTAADWATAQAAGAYTLSTRGVTLEQEGYVHCSNEEQWPVIRDRFYADLDDVVLLVVDPARLSSPVVVEQLGDADAPYPHVYGPIDLDAVVEVRPL